LFPILVIFVHNCKYFTSHQQNKSVTKKLDLLSYSCILNSALQLLTHFHRNVKILPTKKKEKEKRKDKEHRKEKEEKTKKRKS